MTPSVPYPWQNYFLPATEYCISRLPLSEPPRHIPKKKEPKCPPASGAVHAQSQQIIRMLRCHTLLLLLKNHKVLQAVPATAHCHTVDNGCCEPPLPPSVSAISPAAAADWYLQKNHMWSDFDKYPHRVRPLSCCVFSFFHVFPYLHYCFSSYFTTGILWFQGKITQTIFIVDLQPAPASDDVP